MAGIISIRAVSKTFATAGAGVVVALRNVTIDVPRGGVIGVIGESGSGKSTLARVVLGLVKPESGTVSVFGRDLSALTPTEARPLREKMTVVFQEPFESLNPRMRVLQIVEEPLLIHRRRMTRRERRAHVVRTLEGVRLGEEVVEKFPSALSGGEQQRVSIARALITEPEILILDEPTSSLDVSVRSRILGLLARVRSEHNLTYLYISHDIHTVRHLCDSVVVLYRGQVVESGDADQVLEDPRHPYTRALLSCVLDADPESRREVLELKPSADRAPGPGDLSQCILLERCPFAHHEACTNVSVQLDSYERNGHAARCVRAHLFDEAADARPGIGPPPGLSHPRARRT